jgi:hypothetical protein
MLSYGRFGAGAAGGSFSRPAVHVRSCGKPQCFMEDDGSDSREHCPVLLYMNVPSSYISLDDVRDIHELSQQVRNTSNREAIYLVNNLSMRGVETYLHTIQYFERCLHKKYVESRPRSKK